MTSLPPQRERLAQGRRAWIKRSTIALPLLCLFIFGTVIGARLISSGQNASAQSYTTIKGLVPGIVKKSTLVGPTNTSQSISISISLRLRNADNLKKYVDSMTRSESINQHEHLTADQISAAYAPLASSQQSVIDYLQSYGFQVSTTSKQHLVIGFKGTVSDANSAFHILINNYTSTKGIHFYAPASDPSVPANLALLIQSIAGLDNSVHLSHPPIGTTRNGTTHALQANATCPVASSSYFTPAQIATGYNLKSFANSGFHGEGQTIALLELDNYNSADINTYTACYGGSSVPVSRILVDGGPGNPGSQASEVELDMELILSSAPKLANLKVYEAPNDTWAHYMDLWSAIISDNTASVISTSWGTCEANVSGPDLTAENNLFLIAQAQGQTIFAASGDSGTNDCGTGSKAVDDPASQPYVTGVGGTTLTLNSGAYSSETVWNNTYGAGGGGTSSVWPMPAWQSGPGVGTSGNREVPDVSLDSDPNTGYIIYCGVATSCGAAGWYIFGGTSAAAPMWAVFMALTNEKTLHDNGFNIGFINPYLYQIGQSSSMYANDFHDVTAGNNDTLGDGQNIYSATTGYDQASGLGSFNAWNLAKDLETLANNQNGHRGTLARTLWYFADGFVGGSFQEYLAIENTTGQTANVNVQYLINGKPSTTIAHTANASARTTINVNTDLQVASSSTTRVGVAAIVTSTNNVPIVVERPMYFNYLSVPSGSDVLGSNTTHTSFYFAGDSSNTSSDTSSEFITILNPQSTTATVTATFYSGGNVVATQTLAVPSLQRGTITPSYHGKIAIAITSTVGVVAEQSIYATTTISTAGGKTTGAAASNGANSLATDWRFAEGNTSTNFQEYLVISNFTTSVIHVAVRLLYANGSSQLVHVGVNQQSQLFFNVNNANANPVAGCNCTPTTDVAADVATSTPSMTVERFTYFHFNGKPGMTDVTGQPSHGLYTFAEGNTDSSHQEFLALANTTANPVLVAITLFVNGSVMEQEITIPAYTSREININTIVSPMVNAYAPHDTTVSMVVQAFKGSIAAERILYFNVNNQTGGTDLIGYTGN